MNTTKWLSVVIDAALDRRLDKSVRRRRKKGEEIDRSKRVRIALRNDLDKNK